VPVDQGNRPLRNAILWDDARSQAQPLRMPWNTFFGGEA
jgi:hypothetical protein